MSKKYATVLLFKIKQSPLLIKWLVLLHTIAVIATVFNSLAVAYKLVMIILILISLFVYLKHANKTYIIRYSTLSGWVIAYSKNNFYPIEIVKSTVLTRFFIILHFKMQNQKKQAILISKDALDGNEYRKLMVELKISGLAKDEL